MESTNLVELVKNVFTQDTVNHIAAQLQESKSNIEKALDGFIPAVLLRLEAKSTSSRSTILNSVVHNAKNILGDSSELSEGIKNAISDPEDPNGLALTEKSDSILDELFSDRKEQVAEAVADFSGIKPSSSLRLLGATAPASILALYYNNSQEGTPQSEAFLQLVNQKQNIINHVPSGLDLATPLGLNNLSNVDKAPNIPRISDDAQQREPHNVSIIQWIIILVLGLGILFGFYVGCGSNRAGVTMELPQSTSQPAAPEATQNN